MKLHCCWPKERYLAYVCVTEIFEPLRMLPLLNASGASDFLSITGLSGISMMTATDSNVPASYEKTCIGWSVLNELCR